MPTRPRRPLERRGERGLTGPELENLLTGDNLLDHEREPFRSEAARRKAWKKHGAFVMSLQGQPAQGETFGLSRGVYFEIGTRPYAWWRYESPEPRRLLSGDPAGALPERGFSKGAPTFLVSCEAARNIRYESEEEYLRRLDLLTKGEKSFFETQQTKGKEHDTTGGTQE